MAVNAFNEAYKIYTNDQFNFSPDHNHQQKNKQLEDQCNRVISDALWVLCRIGILRLGISYRKNLARNIQSANEGYSITEYGIEWINNYKTTDLLPVSTNKFNQIFEKYLDLYGISYFLRAKEAVSCYLSGNYLACCVMCGAATESIMLSAAFKKEDEEKIIKIYKSSGGRRKIENLVFGQVKSYIQEQSRKYIELLNYWRDETSHGHNSDIDNNEAFVSMLALIRFSEFMQDHWDEITS